MSAASAELSLYERLRLENIARNEAELRRLGLHLARLTRPAQGKQAPSGATRKARAVPPRSRWSRRLQGKPSVNYAEDALDEAAADLSSSSSSSSSSSKRSKKSKAPRGSSPSPPEASVRVISWVIKPSGST